MFPLLHFVMDDLPASTKAPELGDGNARWVMRELGGGGGGEGGEESVTVERELVGRYIAWLVGVGVLDPPREGKGEERLPEVRGVGKGRAVGRSGV